MMTDLVLNPVEVQEGYAGVPDLPGIGIELNEDIVAEFTITE